MSAIVGVRQSPARPEIEGGGNRCKFWQGSRGQTTATRRSKISIGPTPKPYSQIPTNSVLGEGPDRCKKWQVIHCQPRCCTARHNKISVEQSLTKVLQSLTTPLTATARSPRQIATIPRARLPTIGDTRSLSGKAHITARKCKSLTVGRNRVI